MKKKSKYLYFDILKSRIKMGIFMLCVTFILAGIFMYVMNLDRNAEKNGEKVKATIVDIDEQISMNKEEREIKSLTIKYRYNGEEYTHIVAQKPSKYVRVNDVIDIYILDKNPEKIHVYVQNSKIMPYIVIPLFSIAIIGGIYSMIYMINELLVYKKADKQFLSIKANYIDIIEKPLFGNYRCYILLETNQINGQVINFRSHWFNEKYVKNEIEKRNMTTFTVLYNPNNVKQYIVDTNAIDKKMYK